MSAAGRIATAAVFAAAMLAVGVGAAAPTAAGAGGGRPNFLIIQTDDQALDSFSQDVMPRTFRKLVDHGTTLNGYGVSTPLCCPSRSGLLTGQYGHNNGVLRNNYKLLAQKGQTLPVWLRAAGYRTIHIGKYLNHYAQFAGRKPAPGWTDWQTLLDNDYYDFSLSDNGDRVHYGVENSDYVGRVLTNRALDVINEKATKPFYLELDLEAPHSDPGRGGGKCAHDAIPDPSDKISRGPLPEPPSFNEADVSDKPTFIQALATLSAEDVHKEKRSYRCTLASLKGVDRSVHELVGELRSTGQLDDTMIVYISDNGVLRGQHRIRGGKAAAYREAVRVPAVVRMPTGFGTPPATLDVPTANIDLAPTILDLAGAEPCRKPGKCRTMDGRSLLGSLGGDGDPIPSDRDILVELDKSHANEKSGGGVGGHRGPCTFEGLRNSDYWYVHYVRLYEGETCVDTDQREMYDISADPYELDNLYPPSPANQAEALALAAKLATLEDCAGIAGRDAQVDGRPYCE